MLSLPAYHSNARAAGVRLLSGGCHGALSIAGCRAMVDEESGAGARFIHDTDFEAFTRVDT